MDKNERISYWDIVKGIAIMCVVMGHSGIPNTALLYIINYFHMAIFFFVSGALYKEKNDNNPWLYIGKKLKSIYFPVVLYYVFFICIHNLLLHIDFYSTVTNVTDVYGKEKYSSVKIIENIFNAVCYGQNVEELTGALWFCFPFMMSLFFFCIIRKICLIFSNKKKLYYALLILVSIILGLSGEILVVNHIQLAWRSEISLLCMPIILCGFFFCKKLSVCISYLSWYVALFCCFIMIFLYSDGFEISFAAGIISKPIMFYFATFCGIYLCLFIGKLILKLKYLGKLFSYLGKQSFHIMALHFFSFKIVNIFDVIINRKPLLYIAAFPYSNNSLWYLNILIGLFFPLAIIGCIQFLWSKLSQQLNDILLYSGR